MAEYQTSSEDSSSDDDSMDEMDNTSRSKRSSSGIEWCGVETETDNGPNVGIKWPPDPQHLNSTEWRHLKQVQINQPKFGNMMQLYSRTKYNIGVYYDEIKGTQDDSDIHTHLELISAGPVGHVRIQGMLTKYYVAMDSKGRLYSEPNVEEESTIFIEKIVGLYNVYLSKKYKKEGWYLAIKKTGKFKRGPKTGRGQKAAQFLPRRGKFE